MTILPVFDGLFVVAGGSTAGGCIGAGGGDDDGGGEGDRDGEAAVSGRGGGVCTRIWDSSRGFFGGDGGLGSCWIDFLIGYDFCGEVRLWLRLRLRRLCGWRCWW